MPAFSSVKTQVVIPLTTFLHIARQLLDDLNIPQERRGIQTNRHTNTQTDIPTFRPNRPRGQLSEKLSVLWVDTLFKSSLVPNKNK